MKIGLDGALVAASTLLAVAGCVAAPPSGSAAACAYDKVAELPLTFKNGLPTLAVTIDGAPVRLVLDTGATHTTLFDPVVGRMNLPTDWSRQYSTTGISGLSVRHGAIAQRFGLGPIAVADQPLAVAPYSNVAPFDGLLGGDILTRYDIDYDASKRTLALYRWRDCPSGKPDWNFTYRTVSIGFSADTHGLVILPANLGGHGMRAILDTGASGTGLDRDAALKAGFGPDTFAADPVGNTNGIGTSLLHAARHRFDEVTIAGEVLRNVTLSVREPAPLAGIGSAAVLADMLVGEDWLRTRRIWLSYASHRLYIAPTIAAPGTPVQIPFNSSP